MKSQGKPVIGWVEKIDLPEFGIKQISAKIDTGAYSGALHCQFERLVEVDGETWLEFQPLHSDKQFRTKDFSRVRALSTSGHKQERHLVNTRVVIKGKEYPLMITLSNRRYMTYDVIIGRSFLDGKFLVDPSKTNGKVEGGIR